MEEQMNREAAGLSDDDFEDDLVIDDGPSFSSAQDAELEDHSEADAPDASEAVIDELLGVDCEEADIDELDERDDMADDLAFDDLGEMAEDLNEADEDVDSSFVDDML